MSELEEITNGKSLKELFTELRWQLWCGNLLGGTICSHIIKEIENKNGKILTKKEYYKLHKDYRGVWENPQYPKHKGKRTAMLSVGALWVEGEHFIIV